MKKRIILASASPRRKELLQQIGIDFEVIPSSADEDTNEKDPRKLVAELSKLKAQDILEKHPDRCVIAADTVVYAKGEILGKPKTRDEGEAMLLALSGKKHSVFTGVTVSDKNGAVTEVSETEVYFRQLSKSDINKYLDTGDYKDKAGAYGIQGYAARFVERINGCYFNVVGLPLSLLDKILSEKEIV